MPKKILPKLHFYPDYNYDVIKQSRERLLNKSSLLSLYKDKTFNDFNLDQLLNLITLYSDECDNKEILFWLENDWNVKLKLDDLKLILRKLSLKRLFPKTNKYFIIQNKELIDGYQYRSDIISYKNILFTKNNEYRDSFLYYRANVKNENSEVDKYKIGTALSFIEFMDENDKFLDIVDILIIKRFSNAYSISDLILIDLYCSFHNEKITKTDLNEMLKHIQSNFINDFLELNKRLRG